MATEKSIDDCYFYYYSSCTKGDECPFRHCAEALGTETVCSLWKLGQCFRFNCRYRHMEDRMNRSGTPCYWENQPGGCRKPHCVFWHKKLKSPAENQALILPVSTAVAAVPSPIAADNYELTKRISAPLTPPNESSQSDDADESIHSPVPRLVVSLDEGEESDTESLSNTPVKDPNANARSVKSRISDSSKTPQKDFKVKTLEQIRMEKIHKESEHFYKSAYDAPSIDVLTKGRLAEVESFNPECYPPKSEFIPLSNKLESSLDKSVSSKAELIKIENDLRSRLSKKRPLPVKEDVPAVKSAIIFKKQKQETDVAENVDFKIKTLAEIRKEREKKLASHKEDSSESTNAEKLGIARKSQNGLQKTSLRSRIIRRPADSYPAVIPNLKAPSGTGLLKEIQSKVVVPAVQNVSKDKSVSPKKPRHASITFEKSSTAGKRKASTENGETPKVMKLNIPDTAAVPEICPPKNVVSSGLGSFLRHHIPITTKKAAITSEEPVNKPDITSEEPVNKPDITSEEPVYKPDIKSQPLALEEQEKDGFSADIPEEKDLSSPTKNKHIPTTNISSTPFESILPSPVPDVEAKDGKEESQSVADEAKKDGDLHGFSEKEKELSVQTVNDNRTSSMDDIDNYLDDSEDIDLGETTAGDDILLEIEQFLDS